MELGEERDGVPLVDCLAMTLVVVVVAGSVFALLLDDDGPIGILAAVVAGGIAAVWGIGRYRSEAGRLLLWLSIGVNIGFGSVGLLSFGTGSLLAGITAIVWVLGARGRFGPPVVRRQDIGAEIVGFAGAIGLVLLAA